MLWRAYAAPGHDMDALMFFARDPGILITGDALWEHGLGFVWPEANARSTSEKLRTQAAFGRFFAGALYDVYGGVLGPAVVHDRRVPHRALRVLALPDPDVHWFTTDDGVSLELTRYRGGTKGPVKEEQVTMDFAFATVVTIQPIKAGEPFTQQNLWVKRPGTGAIPAERFEEFLATNVKTKDRKSVRIVLE